LFGKMSNKSYNFFFIYFINYTLPKMFVSKNSVLPIIKKIPITKKQVLFIRGVTIQRYIDHINREALRYAYRQVCIVI
jgi:hypothetical protein